MIWLAVAAASVAAPQPIDRLRWYSPDDMPAYHQMAGVTRAVYLRITVRPDGSLQGCEVENDGGDPKLAALTCSITLMRAKFVPARWSDGSSAYGVYRGPVTWAVGSPPPPSFMHGDMELEVDKLPKGQRSPAFANVMFAVDTFGKPSSCSAQPPVFRSQKVNPELVSIACKELLGKFTALPAKDESGNVFTSVQTGTVKFVKQNKKRQ